MLVKGATGVSSAQAAVSTGFPTTVANGTSASIGFIVSLCIVHNCASYRDKSIILLDIRHNYNITEIPREAFLCATSIEVYQNNITNRIKSLTTEPANAKKFPIMICLCNR